MQTTGYAGKPLLKKLGLTDVMKIQVINQPNDYFEWLGIDISNQITLKKDASFVHVFAVTKKELEKHFHQLIKHLSSTAIIWISWYKKSAKKGTDITEDVIREIVLPTGWVDVKVCAVSEEWSGLKIVKRKELR
jgi:hypothetical protein